LLRARAAAGCRSHPWFQGWHLHPALCSLLIVCGAGLVTALKGAWSLPGGSALICSPWVGQESVPSGALGSEQSSSTRGGVFFLVLKAELVEMT